MPSAATILDRCSLTGPLGAPVVAVLGGISATRDAQSWWPAIVGDRRAVDTSTYRVLGFDWLDGGERPDGRPERTVTTLDQADFLAAALDQLGILRLYALIGASYGGMVALAFAERHADRVEQLAIISAPARTHPMSTALRSIQRRIVELGLDTGRGTEALSIARGLAMTTFRSTEEFGDRFDASAVSHQPSAISFPVESYLEHHGAKFARAFTPARFLALSLSGDLHAIDPSACRTPALIVAAARDTIIPREQMVDLSRRWGGPCRLVETQTRTGHDAFLAEPHAVGELIQDLLTSSVSA